MYLLLIFIYTETFSDQGLFSLRPQCNIKINHYYTVVQYIKKRPMDLPKVEMIICHL